MSGEKQVTRVRVEWVDACKSLSIWIVVLLHYGVPSFVDHWFHYFHMPVFFFLSGMVFDARKYTIGQLARRRATTLLWPYIAFATIAYAFWTVAYLAGYGESPIPMNAFAHRLLWDCTNPIKELWGGGSVVPPCAVHHGDVVYGDLSS